MPHPIAPVVAALAATAALASPASHASQPASPGSPVSSVAVHQTTRAAVGNPFRAYPWGAYLGRMEPAWLAWNQATGAAKRHLWYIARQPRDHWFGHWNPDDRIHDQVKEYIADSQRGNPDALVQMAIFRVVPWEHDACRRLPTKAERTSYKHWINRFAAAVGNTPTAIVLQPDGPFALCAPHGSPAPSRLVAYAARVLSAQPRTSVYIEAGAADWPMFGARGGVTAAVKILVRGGIRYTRGLALNGTHYDSIPSELQRAVAIAKTLAKKGFPGRKVVINTSNNGHPFRFAQYTGPDPTNPVVCPSKTTPARKTCEALGVPPTANVDADRWHLSPATDRLARRYVDAYLWFGRPWLHHEGSQTFVTSRAIKLAKTTPFR